MRTSVCLVVLAALAGAGCGGAMKTRPESSASTPSFAVTSDFKPGAVIPRAHTCDGQDVSPPLRAVGLPASAREVVVVMRDHDAPGGDFIHWAVANIRPNAVRSGSPILRAGATPAGAVIGRNSFGSLGYRGPCPPRGNDAHHYEITMYALSRPSMLQAGFSANAVATLHVVAYASLTGVYARR
jgi:Raf kinase inhibitor-like YbhB/YbcL family protein